VPVPIEEEFAMQDDDAAGVLAAERLLGKVRLFAAGLDDDERELFAALLGPGIALAHRDDEVVGFQNTWELRQLPTHLAAVIRDRDVRVIGL
jgi:hypothetical protein